MITFLLSSFIALIPQGNSYVTAHNQTDGVTLSSNSAPFGIFISTSAVRPESRTNILINNLQLPSANAVLVGMQILPDILNIGNTEDVNYRSLKIDAGLTSNNTLSTTFSNNLNNTINLIDKQNITYTFQHNVWFDIYFDNYLVYDGISNIVLNIEKVVDPINLGNDVFHRTVNSTSFNSAQTVQNTGFLGSNANKSEIGVATSPSLLIRLLWTPYFPTLHLNCPIPPSNISTNHHTFIIGQTMTYMFNGSPNAVYAGAYGTGSEIILPVLLTGDPYGTLKINPSSIHSTGTLDNNGLRVVNFTIPNNPSIIGVYVVFQGMVHDGIKWYLTNGADIVIAAP